MQNRRSLTLLLTAIIGTSCAPSPDSMPASPSLPAPPSVSAPPPRTIAGTVTMHDAGGVQPVAGVEVWRWFQESRSGHAAGAVLTDAAGTFTFEAPANTLVYLHAASSGRELNQPCVVAVGPGETRADVRMVPASAADRASAIVGPTLSGIIFETTAAGPQPVRDAGVIVDGLAGLGLTLAVTRTDSSGRYVVCGLVGGSQTLVVYKGGYEIAYASTPAVGRGTLDVELKR